MGYPYEVIFCWPFGSRNEYNLYLITFNKIKGFGYRRVFAEKDSEITFVHLFKNERQLAFLKQYSSFKFPHRSLCYFGVSLQDYFKYRLFCKFTRSILVIQKPAIFSKNLKSLIICSDYFDCFSRPAEKEDAKTYQKEFPMYLFFSKAKTPESFKELGIQVRKLFPAVYLWNRREVYPTNVFALTPNCIDKLIYLPDGSFSFPKEHRVCFDVITRNLKYKSNAFKKFLKTL